MAIGALANGPTFTLGKGPKALQAQMADLQARLRARPGDTFLQNSLKQVKGALGAQPSPSAQIAPASTPDTSKVSEHELRANYNAINGPGAAANATPHELRAAYNQAKGPGAAAGGAPTTGAPASETGNPNNPAGQEGLLPPPTIDELGQQANGVQSGILNQIQSQGAFNPGDFNQATEAARQSAMQSFNLYNQPKFQQQESNFQQMAASRGWAPDSKIYQTAHANMQREQDQATQGAQAQAFQSGLGAQQQGYSQASNTYQMPYQNMAAFNGLNNIQAAQGLQQGAQTFQQGMQGSQNEFQKELAALQHKYNMQLQNSQYHGNPQLAYQNAIGLQNNSAMNQIMVNAATGQPYYPQQGYGNGFAQGIGAGIAGSVT